ncbi:MAG: pentapeptide repeat-containing protein, partial [Pseudomonadota bacterium]
MTAPAPAESHLRPVAASSLREALEAHGRYVQRLAGGRRLSLARADLSDWNLEGAALAEAELAGARLAGAILAGADLSRANLFGADLRDADLRGAILRRTDLRGACLRGANLSGADLSEADLREGRIAMQDRQDGFRILTPGDRQGNVEYAIIAGADLTGVLTAVDATDASLTG